MANPEQTAYLAGGFVAWLIRSTQSIRLGEMRHHYEQGLRSSHPHQACTLPDNMWTEYNISNRRGWYANTVALFSVDATTPCSTSSTMRSDSGMLAMVVPWS